MLVGEKGEGDEFGLGAEESFSILEVAKLFGGEIVMGPEVMGNRLTSVIDTAKSRAVGWQATRKLQDYIDSIRPA